MASLLNSGVFKRVNQFVGNPDGIVNVVRVAARKLGTQDVLRRLIATLLPVNTFLLREETNRSFVKPLFMYRINHFRKV